eukprot:scaffold32453_cov50-Attheya_sp.AAC.3
MAVSTRMDVAKLLCVPEGALDLVTLSEETCATKECNSWAIQYRETTVPVPSMARHGSHERPMEIKTFWPIISVVDIYF